MLEVAQTLQNLGIEPIMALATAQRQQQLVGKMVKRRFVFDSERFSWRSLADVVAHPRRRAASSN
ncbi:MAG TPA: hypothetical protein VEI49_13415, partial [Terriglobales bacterium]|nr:hypothetical protein [Terriglobales bacterium]